MIRKTSLRAFALSHAVAALVLLVGAVSAQPARTTDAEQALDAALVAYERNHWDAAYAAFTALADRGHPEAARFALQMWRHGPALYRRSFVASEQQLGRWSRLWGCGSELADPACLQARWAP
jgi:hypothetical protein